MPELQSRAVLTSVDKVARTATVVLSTFADVQRTDARGPFVERLARDIDRPGSPVCRCSLRTVATGSVACSALSAAPGPRRAT